MCNYHYANTATTHGTTVPPFTDIDFQYWRICENASLRRHRRERERYAVLGIQMQRLLVSMQFINLEEQTLQLEFDSLQQAVHNYWYQRWEFVHRLGPLMAMNWHGVMSNWYTLHVGPNLDLPADFGLAERSMGNAALGLFNRFRALEARMQIARNLWNQIHDEHLFPEQP